MHIVIVRKSKATLVPFRSSILPGRSSGGLRMEKFQSSADSCVLVVGFCLFVVLNETKTPNESVTRCLLKLLRADLENIHTSFC